MPRIQRPVVGEHLACGMQRLTIPVYARYSETPAIVRMVALAYKSFFHSPKKSSIFLQLTLIFPSISVAPLFSYGPG